MNEHIFAPLGMLQSGYGDPAEGLALGYRTYRDTTPVPFDVSSLYASGGVYSTAEDLFRWNEAIYNGELLNDAQLQKMLTRHDENDVGAGSGYGIVVGERFGRNLAKGMTAGTTPLAWLPGRWFHHTEITWIMICGTSSKCLSAVSKMPS